MTSFDIGQTTIVLSGSDFLNGYLCGYQYFSLTRDRVLSDQDLYSFQMKHITDVRHSSLFNSGYITGYMTALTEVIKGDCIVTHVRVQPDSLQQVAERSSS